MNALGTVEVSGVVANAIAAEALVRGEALAESADESVAAQRRRHLRQWLALAVGLLVVALLVGLHLRTQLDALRQEQEDRLRQQASLLAQQFTRQIAAVDAGLLTVLNDLSAWAPKQDWAAVSLRLKALDSAVIATRTILLLDAQGRVIASSRPELTGVDASARSFFQAARTAAPGLQVSPPYRTQLGVWAFNVSRPVITADGRFWGVVTATLDPEWIAVSLGTTNYASDMWAALAHSSGHLVQIVPAPPKSVGGVDLAKPGAMFTRHRDSGTAESVFTGSIASTGQAHRIIVQRTLLADLPPDSRLVLALSRDLDAVLAAWWQQAWAGAAFIALLAGFGSFGLARVQRGERQAAAAAVAARQALQAQERRWALALASMDLGVWDADLPKGREYHSASFCRLLGLPDAEGAEAALAWQDRLHPDDAPGVRQRLEAHLVGRSPAFEARCRLRAGDGSWRWMRIGGLVVERADGGDAKRIVGTLHDETDRVQAEALRRERDRAEAASQAKSVFMSNMSHEMRTPLNAVLGFAQLLRWRIGQPGADLAEQRRQIELIEQGGRHLLALVEDVLDLSRVERGQLDMSLQPVALAPLLSQAVALVEPLARQEGLQISLKPPPEEATVRADPLRLSQVLNNLLANAIKYNRPAGSVMVHWRRDEAIAADTGETARGGWRIEVQDTGRGLSAEQQAHLFEPFNRLGHENSAIAGTGLGLVLSRRFVEQMGGRLTVSSEVGAGSTFSVWLPSV